MRVPGWPFWFALSQAKRWNSASLEKDGGLPRPRLLTVSISPSQGARNDSSLRLSLLLNKREDQSLSFWIRVLKPYPHFVAKRIFLASVFAYNRVELFIKFIVVVGHIPELDHALCPSVYFFNIDAPFRYAGNSSIKLLADIVLHVFNLLVFDRSSFRLGSLKFSFTAILR